MQWNNCNAKRTSDSIQWLTPFLCFLKKTSYRLPLLFYSKSVYSRSCTTSRMHIRVTNHYWPLGGSEKIGVMISLVVSWSRMAITDDVIILAVPGKGQKYSLSKHRHITYLWKGNFTLNKSSFETYVRKLTGEEWCAIDVS